MECGYVRMLGARTVVVRNGYWPERHGLTEIGSVWMRVLKVWGRAGSGCKFNRPSCRPTCVARGRFLCALPWLYLNNVPTEDRKDALALLVGDDARGLSSNVVSRMK